MTAPTIALAGTYTADDLRTIAAGLEASPLVAESQQPGWHPTIWRSQQLHLALRELIDRARHADETMVQDLRREICEFVECWVREYAGSADRIRERAQRFPQRS